MIDPDLRVGSTSTRVSDFVNRGKEFDGLYIFPPLLDACCRVIGRPFKLSSLQARTLRPHTPAQELNVDVRRDSADWPLLGFILMVDDFRQENGATRFVPGSHQCLSVPESTISDLRADDDGQVLACGPAGSFLIFNRSAYLCADCRCRVPGRTPGKSAGSRERFAGGRQSVQCGGQGLDAVGRPERAVGIGSALGRGP